MEIGGTPSGAEQFRAPEGPASRRLALIARKQHILDFGDITPEDLKILEQPVFEVGEAVWAPLSSGKVEEGWTVSALDTAASRVEVTKEVGGQKQSEWVSEEELARFNP